MTKMVIHLLNIMTQARRQSDNAPNLESHQLNMKEVMTMIRNHTNLLHLILLIKNRLRPKTNNNISIFP